MVAIDVSTGEYGAFNPNVLEVFSGCAQMKDGYLWVSEEPGWGVEVDEKSRRSFRSQTPAAADHGQD